MARQPDYPSSKHKGHKGLCAGSNRASRPGWRALPQALMRAEEQVPSRLKEILIPSHPSYTKPPGPGMSSRSLTGWPWQAGPASKQATAFASCLPPATVFLSQVSAQATHTLSTDCFSVLSRPYPLLPGRGHCSPRFLQPWPPLFLPRQHCVTERAFTTVSRLQWQVCLLH